MGEKSNTRGRDARRDEITRFVDRRSGKRYIDFINGTGRVGWISAFRSLRDFNDSDYAGDRDE